MVICPSAQTGHSNYNPSYLYIGVRDSLKGEGLKDPPLFYFDFRLTEIGNSAIFKIKGN